jgi:uncharacterized protein (TIGR02996 family)
MNEAGFLEDIAANPEDDTPRLVYADWLEEHGTSEADRARGEFIRGQVGLAKLSLDDPRRPELEARELRLLGSYRKGWVRPLRGWTRDHVFRRGLVEQVTLPAETFLARAKELARLAPVVAIHLTHAADHAAELAASPHLKPIRSLRLSDPRFIYQQAERGWRRRRPQNSLGLDTLRVLLGSRHLTSLRELDVRDCNLAQAGARLLAESPRLAQVESLDLRNNDHFPEDVAVLAGSPHLGKLRALRLGSVSWFNPQGEFVEDGIGLLPPALAPLVGRLELLDAGSCGVQPGGLGHLGEVKRTVPLRALLLERSILGAFYYDNMEAFRAMARGPLLGDLHMLDMSSCYLDLDRARALAASPNLAGLVDLRLNNNPLGPRGLEALTSSKHLARLRALAVAGSMGFWREEGYSLGDAGVRHLARATGLPSLARLDLRANGIEADGVKALAGSPLAERLVALDLANNDLGDAGAKALLSADWPRLAHLDVRGNGLSARAQKALRKRFGHVVRYTPASRPPREEDDY